MKNATMPFAETDSSSDLWELIGVRIRGLDTPILGAVRFHRQEAGSNARCSLAEFLSSPPGEESVRDDNYPANLLRLAVKPEERSFAQFLGDLAFGVPPRQVLIDLGLVEVAFDFRTANPSIEETRFLGHTQRRMLCRSVAGHVISGVFHSPGPRLSRPDPFFGVSAVTQITPMGPLPLPNLIFQRRFLSLVAEDDGGGLERLPPFQPAASAQMPLIGAVAWRFFSRVQGGAPDALLRSPRGTTAAAGDGQPILRAA